MSNYSNTSETLFTEGQLSTADLQAVVGGATNLDVNAAAVVENATKNLPATTGEAGKAVGVVTSDVSGTLSQATLINGLLISLGLG